jgi:hypothetical protein
MPGYSFPHPPSRREREGSDATSRAWRCQRPVRGTRANLARTASPGARAYYDQLRARKIKHDAALRQLANRLVGILHGCLKTRTLYDEATAWPQHSSRQCPTAA